MKGKGIYISNDLTKQQRDEINILKQHLEHFKESYENCYIKGNKLYIDNIAYTREEIEILLATKQHQSESASATPVPQRTETKANEDTEEPEEQTEKPSNNIEENQPPGRKENPKDTPKTGKTCTTRTGITTQNKPRTRSTNK